MRLPAVAAVVVTILAAACDDDSSGEPECTPPPAIDLTLAVTVTNAQAYVGRPAAMRVLAGGSIVMSCSTAIVPASGALDLTGGAFGPVGDARMEIVLSSDGNAALGPNDLRFALPLGAGTLTGEPCAVERSWTAMLDAAATAPTAITWTPGLACPGE